MKILLLALLSTTACFGLGPYPPKADDARVETYRKVGDVELKLWIFGESDPAKPKPAIVFFFGGGWKSGSPAQFERQARHFAERGMIAITADYRVASRHKVKPVECVKDAKAAIAWTRENAKRLGIDPDRIAAAGGSAGGHIAACTGTVSGFGSDERPNAMVLFNPGLALLKVGDWEPKGFGTGLSAERLGAEPEALSPAHNIGDQTPPTLILHGTKDTTVPYASAEAFAAEMTKANRPCKLVGYEGQSHAFFNRGTSYEETLAEADAFLVELGWLKE